MRNVAEAASRVTDGESLSLDEGEAALGGARKATAELQGGSPVRHRRMESPSHPPLTFAFHDKATIPAGLVRKILIRDVGLDEEGARKLL
jgi:hypothetical protein